MNRQQRRAQQRSETKNPQTIDQFVNAMQQDINDAIARNNSLILDPVYLALDGNDSLARKIAKAFQIAENYPINLVSGTKTVLTISRNIAIGVLRIVEQPNTASTMEQLTMDTHMPVVFISNGITRTMFLPK